MGDYYETGTLCDDCVEAKKAENAEFEALDENIVENPEQLQQLLTKAEADQKWFLVGLLEEQIKVLGAQPKTSAKNKKKAAEELKNACEELDAMAGEPKVATGEMSKAELAASGREEWPWHYAIADALGGTVEPFDQYQGPYIDVPGEGRLFINSEDGSSAVVWNEKTKKSSEPFFEDNGAVDAALEVLENPPANTQPYGEERNLFSQTSPKQNTVPENPEFSEADKISLKGLGVQGSKKKADAGKTAGSEEAALARVVAAFGDEDKALEWLTTPNQEFGGDTPFNVLAAHGFDLQVIEPFLVRMEHGVDYEHTAAAGDENDETVEMSLGMGDLADLAANLPHQDEHTIVTASMSKTAEAYYTSKNFRTKKDLRDSVLLGRKITVYDPGQGMGGEAPPPVNGEVAVAGPHYPEPHRWYARVKLQDGFIVGVK